MVALWHVGARDLERRESTCRSPRDFTLLACSLQLPSPCCRLQPSAAEENHRRKNGTLDNTS